MSDVTLAVELSQRYSPLSMTNTGIFGMLALHHAVEQMDLETARSLLEQGEHVDAKDPAVGMATALHLAVDIECEDACRRFDEGDAHASPVPTLTKLLIDFDADPFVSDAEGKTLRDWAVERKHLAAIALFDAKP